MSSMVFVGQVPRDYGGHARDAARARDLRDNPGRWGLVDQGRKTRAGAVEEAGRIRRGEKAAYLPKGAFEARAITTEEGVHQVWARFVGVR